MTAMRDVVHQHGIPEALYTDRAGWAFDTPKAGGKVSATNMTQVGEALARLGVEHIPSYSPQARGRSERMNRTLQDRLVNELRVVAQATTVEQANQYLLERYLPTHNEEFAKPPADPVSAFVGLDQVDLDQVFFEELPQERRKRLRSTPGSSPQSALTGHGAGPGALECRPTVAFGSLRPALLPLAWHRRPSESGQITCQNRADTSLVINRGLSVPTRGRSYGVVGRGDRWPRC
jgi:hypothetical protein